MQAVISKDLLPDEFNRMIVEGNCVMKKTRKRKVKKLLNPAPATADSTAKKS